ncbi:MAG TPA: protein translocase subunit SecD [Armatimonadota bacterium]|nr:protein translocase subunit SecD [Armatimonadota bacterium]
MRKHSIWLIGVILLTVVAFLYVFKPVTVTPRKDPADASRYLRPVGLKGAFDASLPPQQASFNVFNGKLPLYVYVPQHDLSLGLDLRGGMRVVLEIADHGEFDYKLNKPIIDSSTLASTKGSLTDAVKAALGKDGEGAQIELSEDRATITTQATNQVQAETQLKQINTAMTQVFGAGSFSVPDSTKVFKTVDKQTQDNVRNIMEKRVNPDGTKEVNSTSKGTNQVVLEIPGEKDPDHVQQIIGKTAEMNFMLLPPNISVGENPDGSVSMSNGSQTVSDEDALKSSILVVRGRDLKSNCDVTFDQQRKPAVSFEMKTKEAKERFGAITGANVNRYLAIVLDGKVISAPVIKSRIDGNGIISGGFKDMTEARDLSTLLNAGALPVNVNIVENRVVSATLGADSVSASLIAGMIGLLAVLIFMVAYYRLPGLMADFALIIYVFLSLAVIKMVGSTLTLPGIAGIIISIGMAVDANVIIFERLKEELRTQKPLETAMDVAFARAWTAILDSNVASLITGTVLYMLGTGAVQNFAVTLWIGVAVSLFTAVTVTRLFMRMLVRSRTGHNLAWYGV